MVQLESVQRLSGEETPRGFSRNHMDELNQFRNVEAWRSALGLLPVPLRADVAAQGRFVLLNGSSGNFCLDFVGGGDRASRCAAAWSSDVGHYLTFVDNVVLVNRWDRLSAEERYSSGSVVSRLHEFHRHLEKSAPSRSQNVVNHILRIFRRIRAAVDDESDGRRSLKVLLHLLATAASEQSRFKLDVGIWGLPSDVFEVSENLTTATWEPLYRDLVGLGRYDTLIPDIELVIRHVSGSVFQEAHLEARLSNDKWLPGFEVPVEFSAAGRPEIGVHFTPPSVARTLAEEAVRSIVSLTSGSHLRLFDPACGSGELLKECLRLLKLQNFDGTITVIGWDKSIAAIDMARFVLSWESRSWTAGQVQLELLSTDSVLERSWPTKIDLLIMNPPFLSWQQMSALEKESASEKLGSMLRNKPNLASVFALRALDSLDTQGVLGMIAPASLLESSSGREVRAAMASALNPLLIARLGNQNVFAHALVDAGMYVGRGKGLARRDATAVLWADSQQGSLGQALRGLRRWRGAEAEELDEGGFSVYQRKEMGITGAPWIARGYKAWRFHEALRRNRATVSADSIFEIKQGVRLGSDVFIVGKDYVYSLPESERAFFRPAVMNLSIQDARLNDAYHVFYPYTEGLPLITTEVDLAYHLPHYFRDMLLPVKNKLASRKSLVKADLEWWDLLWHRSWLTAPKPRIVSKYFGGARSFAFDEAGIYVVVVGNGWVLKKGAVSTEITEEEICLAMLTFLSGGAADLLLQYASVQVSGGQWDLSHRFLKDMPIPNLSNISLSLLNDLVGLGRKISKPGFEDWKDVDELVLAVLAG